MFKNTMRVMMISMLAMLGAEAEAHWINVGGRCYWHSGECVRKDKDAPPPDAIPIDTVGELVSTVHQVEILCPGRPNPRGQIVNGEWTLTSGKKPIVQSDITTVAINKVTRRNAEWSAVVSDAYFLEGLDVDASCLGGVPPLDVIIRSMSAQMNLYCDPAADPACKTQPNQIHSRWRAESCVLSDKFNFTHYPKNVPIPGVPFACSGISTCHADECPLP